MNYIDDVFRYAMARLNNREDAEDIASEVIQALPNPCFRRELRIYMIGMARRKVADHRRRWRDEVSLRDLEATRSFDDQADHSTMVNAVLLELSVDHREVLALKYVVGMSSTEIGAVLARRSDAVDSLLQRARAAFAAEWTRITSEEVEW